MLLEMQQRVVAEEAADGASHHPFHASKQGGHVVAPVAPGRRLHATLGRHADHAGAEPGDRTSLQTVRPCGSS